MPPTSRFPFQKGFAGAVGLAGLEDQVDAAPPGFQKGRAEEGVGDIRIERDRAE
jgi:hypothetical protein